MTCATSFFLFLKNQLKWIWLSNSHVFLFEAVPLCCDHSARPWNDLNPVSDTVSSCCDVAVFSRRSASARQVPSLSLLWKILKCPRKNTDPKKVWKNTTSYSIDFFLHKLCIYCVVIIIIFISFPFFVWCFLLLLWGISNIPQSAGEPCAKNGFIIVIITVIIHG